MKKTLSGIIPLLLTAVFVYGIYSYYYEFLWFNNILLVFLNALLSSLMLGICAAISQKHSRKNSKKNIALVGIAVTVICLAFLFGMAYLVNAVIYEGITRPQHEQEARWILSASVIALGAILISLYARLLKNVKALKLIISAVLATATLCGSFALSYNYINFEFLQPVYRAVWGIGGIKSEVDGLNYSFTSALNKVQPTDRLEKNDDINIALAKNEWESFQFVLASGNDNQTVSIEVSDFKNADGDTMPVSIYKEHYVECQYPINKLGHWFPDALIPFKSGESATLTKNSTQTFFIETRSTADTKSGEYTATVTLKDNNGETAMTQEITAEVWNFTLPEGHYAQTAIGCWSETIASEDYEEYYNYLLDQGISPYNLPFDILDERADAYMSDPRVTSFQIPYYGDDETLKKAFDKIQSNPEWAKKAYFYPADEPGSEEAFANLTAIKERLEKICPGYSMITPLCAHDVEIGGEKKYTIDLVAETGNRLCIISSMLTDKTVLNKMNDYVNTGNYQPWWYVCCDPDDKDGYGNAFIYQDALRHRTLFWQQYDYGISGLLYWNTASYVKCDNPWENALTWDSWDSAGDGMWIYPGNYIGIDSPVGSLRVKHITAGLEDFDYLKLAENQFGKDWVDTQVARITSSLTKSTSDVDLFEEVRREIGEKLSTANK